MYLSSSPALRVADRHHRNVRDLHLVGRKSRNVRRASVSWRRRIAVGVEDAAALDPVAVSHRSFGVHVAHDEAVVLRIAVDQQRDRAVLLRFARLDAAERSPVAREGDLAFHRHTHRIELRVVFDEAVVHVDDFGRRVPLAAVPVDRRILRERGRRISLDRRLGEGERLGIRRHAGDAHRRRLRHPDVVAANLGLEPHDFICAIT